MPQRIRVIGTGQLLDLQAKLRRAGHENLRQSMQRRIRRAAEPLRDGMQDTIRNLPINSEGRKAGKRGGPSPTTRPFRGAIADAVRISVRNTGNPGARVWLDKSLLPPDISVGAVNQLNSGRLRHPVFGNKKRWTNQFTTPLWWDKTVRAHTPRMTREVERIVDDVRRRLE